MTVTLDAFVTGDEAVVLMTGLPMGRVPTLIDRTSGARSVCQSTLVDGIPGMCLSFGYFDGQGRSPAARPASPQRHNAWIGTVPIQADEAKLTLVAGDLVQSFTVRRGPSRRLYPSGAGPSDPLRLAEITPVGEPSSLSRKCRSGLRLRYFQLKRIAP